MDQETEVKEKEVSHEEIRHAAHDYAKFRENEKASEHDFESGALWILNYLNINIKKQDNG